MRTIRNPLHPPDGHTTREGATRPATYREIGLWKKEKHGRGLVQEAQAIGKINNNANRKEGVRFFPTLKGLGFLAQLL